MFFHASLVLFFKLFTFLFLDIISNYTSKKRRNFLASRVFSPILDISRNCLLNEIMTSPLLLRQVFLYQEILKFDLTWLLKMTHIRLIMLKNVLTTRNNGLVNNFYYDFIVAYIIYLL